MPAGHEDCRARAVGRGAAGSIWGWREVEGPRPGKGRRNTDSVTRRTVSGSWGRRPRSADYVRVWRRCGSIASCHHGIDTGRLRKFLIIWSGSLRSSLGAAYWGRFFLITPAPCYRRLSMEFWRFILVLTFLSEDHATHGNQNLSVK